MIGTGVWAFLRTRGEADNSVIAKKCGLRILSPGENASVKPKIRLEGSYEKKPPEGSMTVLEKSPSTSTYWFKKQTPEFDTARKLWWFSDIYVGGKKDDERILCLAIVGDSGRALMDYYFSVRDELKKPVGVKNLPKDFFRCAQVSVRRAESDPEPVINDVPTRERYGMKIIEPTDNSLVGTKISLRGIFELRPPEDGLVIYERTKPDGLYWFKQEVPDFDEDKKQWSAEIYIGNEENTVRTPYVGMLGETGKALRTYFQAVNEQCNGQWAGLRKMPPDVKPPAEVNVRYSANPKMRLR